MDDGAEVVGCGGAVLEDGEWDEGFGCDTGFVEDEEGEAKETEEEGDEGVPGRPGVGDAAPRNRDEEGGGGGDEENRADKVDAAELEGEVGRGEVEFQA